eukprot:7646193-Pyramimonas_sp.AAC.1
MGVWALAGPGMGLYVNCSKTQAVLLGPTSVLGFKGLLRRRGIDSPGLVFAGCGKYLGLMLGPGGLEASWKASCRKYLGRVGLVQGLCLGRPKSAARCNMLA